jgi:hypothetical protein
MGAMDLDPPGDEEGITVLPFPGPADTHKAFFSVALANHLS